MRSGPEATGITTASFNAVAARGRRFRQAYATVPETLPSHASLMTGLYPAGHGIHENARRLPDATPVLAEQLKGAGYRTAAVVASFVLAKQFGLARGFDVYDDRLPEGRQERTAREVTDAAMAALGGGADAPLFMWVHYWDPHHPYTPPEPFRSAHPASPYLGEVAYMDAELGRLVEAFERRANGPTAIIIVGDHGEGLGDHGESQHGNLLYQSTMHVPLVVAGPGVTAGTVETPVSIRRVYHTVLDWAGLGAADSLRGESTDVVLGEAMKPFLEYGWQPQIMAVQGRQKAIFAGTTELYDVVADPREARNLAGRRGCACGPARGARRLPGAVAGSGAHAGGLERRGSAEAGEPGLRQRHGRSRRQEGRAAAGGHGAAVRAARAGVRVVCGRAIQAGHSAVRADSRGRSATTSMRCSGSRRRIRRSGTTAQAEAMFETGGASWRRSRPTCRCTSRCTTPGRRTGSARCRCWSRWRPSTPTGCRRSRPWPRA